MRTLLMGSKALPKLLLINAKRNILGKKSSKSEADEKHFGQPRTKKKCHQFTIYSQKTTGHPHDSQN